MTDRRPWAAPWGWIAKCPAAGGGAAETAAPQALSGESLEEQSPLQELIQRHGGLMLELARRRAGPAAEDLVQQTLLWMAERQKDWAGLEEARLAAYLAAALGGQWAEMRRQRRGGSWPTRGLLWRKPPCAAWITRRWPGFGPGCRRRIGWPWRPNISFSWTTGRSPGGWASSPPASA